MKIIKHKKIWDKSPHSAFTDLCRYQGQFYCVFRSAIAHVSDTAELVILVSSDGNKWHKFAEVSEPECDLRDGKWLIFNNTLYLNAAAVDRRPQCDADKRLQSLSWTVTSQGVSAPRVIVSDNYWLWKCAANAAQNLIVGGAYRGGPEGDIRLYTSLDGDTFTCAMAPLNNQGYVNEAAPLFVEDDLYVLLRRDPAYDDRGSALLGCAPAPYLDWQWLELTCRVGGPTLFSWHDKLLAIVRLYNDNTRTSLIEIDKVTGQVTECLTMPSGGDTSYAGVVLENDCLSLSYYSSHEGHSCIYFAKISLS
ncbi:exo-alpha-sialidase [Shewanella sp. SNU WT4]|uniref:exo-alpha-sialidase n=1 Tax=Shewanella sp. SNU WT4 TaxID=2590015 RepID=UPI00112AAFE5|nr:exo-alpha-sialidase [Shewanella sp. SNU WT4]QDF67487.1 exo-alpha-sialidase [Shewanella sp. SNU WT4]